MVANHITDFQPQIDFFALWLVSSDSMQHHHFFLHEQLDQEALFLQSTILPQSSSKSMVIHLFYILLIALEHTTILKSTKSSKSQTESTSSSCHVISPWNSSFHSMSKFIKSSASILSIILSMSPDNNQLCKHSTDSTDSIRWFRRSLNVNLALDVSTRFQSNTC